jgi:multidrug resistance efflux pump
VLAIGGTLVLLLGALGIYLALGGLGWPSSEEDRTKALGLQGEVNAILAGIASADRGLAENVASLKSELETIERARGRDTVEAETQRARLEELNQELAVVREFVNNGAAMVALRGRLAVADADVTQRRYEQAAVQLAGIRADVDALRRTVASIPVALESQRACDAMVQRVASLRDLTILEVVPSLPAGVVASAEASLARQDFTRAAAEFEEARRAVAEVALRAIDMNVSGLKGQAENAMTQGDLAAARTALDTARELVTLRGQFAL